MAKRKKGSIVRNFNTEVCSMCRELVFSHTGRIIRVYPYEGIKDNRTFHMECADRHLSLMKGINPDQLQLFTQEEK